MTYSYLVTISIICPLVFLAGFVDSIAGGGGLIAIPAYLFAGLPIHVAYGTNKMASCMGTTIASINYLKSGKVFLPVGIAGGVFALIGSWYGTQLALFLSPKILQICLMIILPLVVLLMLSNRHFGTTQYGAQLPLKKALPLASVIGLVVGAYDGFFGPGTGMFLALLFSSVLVMDLVTASGTAKIVNLSSNFASAIAYIINGKVLYAVAIPAACSAILGNFIGSKLAIKIGPTFIKPIIAIMAILLCIKVIVDIF